MTFISYAQNFEDVLLWRALGHIKHGFYIDVGANDPEEHSVTKAFYDVGWRGVNIEPLPAFHQQFMAQRPRDINLAIAAGATDGSLTLFDVPAVNGWASPDRTVAEAHRADGFAVTELTVPVRTLAGVCAEHARGEIHFLKVDVEGFEGEVLRGMDFDRWRPWLLVIEATLPNSRVTNHESWEHLVTGKGYRYAHFDGLNRYYVSDQHPELFDVLEIQPNVFDEFISHHLDKAWKATAAAAADGKKAHERLAHVGELQWKAEQRAGKSDELAQQAMDHAAELLTRYDAANARAQQLAAEQATLVAAHEQLRREHEQLQQESRRVQEWGHDLEHRLLATYASASWRVTRPLRMVGSAVRRFSFKGVMRALLLRATRSERMRRLLIPLMLRLPDRGAGLSQALNTIKHDEPVPAATPAADQVPDELKALPVSARRVLADLQRARSTTTKP
ncbi:MAG: FkbM family methyltransferase [Pseudomonadota bacterium]